jgi:hypothetical protein
LHIGKYSVYLVGELSEWWAMEPTTLVKLGEVYGGHMGLTLSTVSTYAAQDGKWLGRLTGGASCTLRKANTVMSWFDQNWPVDLEWPRHIPRPNKSKKEAA